MELFEAMLTMPSVKSYTDDPVSEEDVRTILEAATWAPNAQNRQLWEFVVVRDPEGKKELADIYREALTAVLDSCPKGSDSPATFDKRTAPKTMLSWSHKLAEEFENVPVIIVAGWDIAGSPLAADGVFKFFRDECVLTSVMPAVQNMMLAARALGLGTCLTTVANVYEGRVKEALNAPESIRIAAMIPVGYPTDGFKARKRIPVDEKLHFERFS